MRKLIYTSLTMALLLTPLSSVFAHPGRTDSNGGHTCRTNCTERWGLEYGEYHYHNGGGSSSSGGSSYKAPAAPAPKAPVVQPKKQAPVVLNKTIIAVEKADVYTWPEVNVAYDNGDLHYGTEIKDQGGTPGWNTISYAGSSMYVSKNHTTSYTPITAKSISVKVEKAYLFNIPSASGKARNSAVKGTSLTAIGQNGNFWYVKSNDGKWNGFISKTVAY